MRLLSLLCLLLFCSSAFAQNRSDHPFQLQVNLSGLVLKGLGKSISGKETLKLDVKQWEVPGVSLGYHISDAIFIGYAFHPNRNLVLQEEYSFSDIPDSDILISVDHNTGTFHSLNGRFSPFSAGVYGSVFFTYVSAADYDLTGVPINEAFSIAGTLYEDALNAQWNFKDLTTLGIGLGYNHVSKSGLSFDIGGGVPLNFVKSVHENIKIINEDGMIDANDAEHVQQILEDEQFYFPIQLYFSIGKNF